MRVIRKVISGVLIAVLTIFLVFLSVWFIVIPAINNLKLSSYARKLQAFDAGGEYETVEQIRACGKLFGNGNGMEYLVLELVKSEGLTETAPSVLGEGIVVFRADNEEQWRGLLNEYTRYNSEEMLEILEATEDLSQYYFLYSFHSADYGSILTWDLRAH